MAEPNDRRPGITISLGQLQAGTLLAVIGGIGAALYTGISWIERMQALAHRNAELLVDTGKQLEGLRGMLSQQIERTRQEEGAIRTLIATRTDTFRQGEADLKERLTEIQHSLALMEQNYRHVRTLETRYDQAFATYQPQPRRKR